MQCKGNGPRPDTGGLSYASGYAVATARYGFVSTGIHGVADSGGWFEAAASARFTDTVSILGPKITGIELDVFTEKCAMCAPLNDLLTLKVDGNAVQMGVYGGPNTITFPTGLTKDFDLSGTLSSWACAFDNDDYLGGQDTSARITAIRLLDTHGDQLRKYHYRTESGAAYPFVGGSLLPGVLGEVPEPSPSLLVGLSAITLWAGRKVLIRDKRRNCNCS